MEVHSVFCEVLAESSYSIVVTIRARRFFCVQTFYSLPKEYIYVFCGDIITKIDYLYTALTNLFL
jgi:hypothetical protein